MVIILNVSTLIFYLLYTFVPHIFVWGSCFWLCTPACLPACLLLPPPPHNLLTHHLLAHHLLTHIVLTHNLLTQTLLTHHLLSHTHTALSHTQLSHTHRAYSHTHTYSQSQRSTIYWHTTRRGTSPHRTSLCVAGVALGDMDRHFAWWAWHLWHLAGSGGALGTRLAPLLPRLFVTFCVFPSPSNLGKWWTALQGFEANLERAEIWKRCLRVISMQPWCLWVAMARSSSIDKFGIWSNRHGVPFHRAKMVRMTPVRTWL